MSRQGGQEKNGKNRERSWEKIDVEQEWLSAVDLA